MALYTRRGDNGHTDVPGDRVRKDAPLPSALGALDELNASVGLCLSEADRISHVYIRDSLAPVRSELLTAGADLAVGAAPGRLAQSSVDRIERDIDAVCDDLPELKHFILPGGSELAARLHVARVVARRAERALVAAVAPAPGADDVLLRYVNRLGDLLFALARLANRDAGDPDVPWAP